MSGGRPQAAMIGPRLSLMMFLQFFIWGAWYVSIPGWMETKGLRGLGGWVYTVGPIAAVISPFFLGMVADRFFATQKVLGVMHLLGGAMMLAVPSVVGASVARADAGFLHPLVLLLLGHMLCYMPTLGLTNTLCFHHMTDPSRQFPVVRVFGTIGWIVGNIVVGGNLKTWGLSAMWLADGANSPVQFTVTGAAAIVLGLFSFTLPRTPPPSAGKTVTVREVLGLDSLVLLRDRSYLVFVVCSFLICIPLAGYYSNGFRFVTDEGFGNPALTMSYGQMSEIIFMLLMPVFFARLGVKWMLAVGMLAWVVRYGFFSAAAPDRVAWMVLAGVILHGICYDFFFVTGFIYVDRRAPKEIRGQAQGFLVLITQGLGLGVGAQLFSRLVGRYTGGTNGAEVRDWQQIWLWPCVFAAAVLVVFVVAFKDDGGRSKEGAGA